VKKLTSFLFWGFLSILGGIAFASITQLFSPGEGVNALWLVIAAACFYIIAYRLYGSFLAAKVFALDDRNITPAYRLADNKDYCPTNKWVLFGHHFAAIAGAGPLIGPVLAAQFGYLPGALWLLIGAVFAGGVHDFIILMASVRRNGSSLAEIARKEVGLLSGVAAALCILFIIVVAMAGLGLVVVNALTRSPWGTFSIGMTIPIALLMGFYMHSFRPGKVKEVTILGVSLLLLAIIFGGRIPGSSFHSFFDMDRNILIILMALYGFFASVLPVWMLMAPRDYLSTYMKIGIVFLLALGVMTIAPTIQMPATTAFIDGGGPVIPGTLFPFMFITIACGAVSGFHSLIASGTTPKMIEKESHMKLIGFGAMLTEGFVGIIALIAATILIPGDYFSINTHLSPEQLAQMGFPIGRIKELSQLVGVEVAGRPGGAVSLAVGMASIFSALPGMKHLMSYWYNFAILFEALFILTTIDTGTRVARFVLQEIGGYIYKPLGRTSWLPGALFTTAVVVMAWGYLIYSGSVATIWPMFGVANQLLATFALSVGTTVLIRMGKTRYIWTTLTPMVFMAVTTLAASWKLFFNFLENAHKSVSYTIDAVLVALMASLVLVILVDSAWKWLRAATIYARFGIIKNSQY
jgi:carbon starvation protein